MSVIQDRRVILAVGAALLVGGWGVTRYADFNSTERTIETSQTETEPGVMQKSKTRTDTSQWSDNDLIYATGVAMMAVGAGLIGFGVTRPAAACGTARPR